MYSTKIVIAFAADDDDGLKVEHTHTFAEYFSTNQSNADVYGLYMQMFYLISDMAQRTRTAAHAHFIR